MLRSYPRISIIFHWDSDGIASASLLKELAASYGIETQLIVPTIGYYNVDAIPLSKIKDFSPHLVIVVDYALKPWDLEQLEYEAAAPVMVLDHHVNQLPEKPLYHNPVARGLPGELYPSTTWVLQELLRIDVNLRILLGIAGDRGVKASETPIWDTIEQVLKERKWDWNKIIELAEMIDSNYRIGDYNGITRAVDKLIAYGESLEEALADEEWAKKKKLVDTEIDKLAQTQPIQAIDNGILVYEIESRYYVASAVTRKLALKHQDKVVIVAYKHMGEGPCHVYARSWKYNLAPAITLLSLRDYEVGGKKEVVAVTIDCEQLNQALQDMIEVVKEAIQS